MKIYLSKREAADPAVTTRLEAAGYECVAFAPPPYPLVSPKYQVLLVEMAPGTVRRMKG